MAHKPTAVPTRRSVPRPMREPTRSGLRAVRVSLTRERIIAAALAQVERDGLAAFSIRGLGATLGCEPMSVYHYFPSKAHLQYALVDDVLASIVTDPPGIDPIERLRAMAHSCLALARRHPKLFPMIAVHRLNTLVGVRLIEGVLALVHAAIPDDRLAAQYFRVLGYYLTGAALDDTAGYASSPSAAEPVSDAYIEEHCPRLVVAGRYHRQEWWESTFELGLESLLGAMRAAVPAVNIAVAVTQPSPKPVIRPKH